MIVVNPPNVIQNGITPVNSHSELELSEVSKSILRKTTPFGVAPTRYCWGPQQTSAHPAVPCSSPVRAQQKAQPATLGAHAIWPLSPLGKGIKTLFPSLVYTSANSFTAWVSSPNHTMKTDDIVRVYVRLRPFS